MSRPIKFRAWGGEDFYTPILYDNKVFRNGRDFEDFIPCGDTIEQFTGLHDKNGVEIYEGDIVRDQHSYSDANVGAVWYRASLGSAVGWMVNQFYMSSMSSEIEVLGNIHQNPELVEGQS